MAQEGTTTPSASSDTAVGGASTGAPSGKPRLLVKLKFKGRPVAAAGEIPSPRGEGPHSSHHHSTRGAVTGDASQAGARDDCAAEALPREPVKEDGAGKVREIQGEERSASPGQGVASEEEVSQGGAAGTDAATKVEEGGGRDGAESLRRSSGNDGEQPEEGANEVPGPGEGVSSLAAAPPQPEVELCGRDAAVHMPTPPSPTSLAAAPGSEEAPRRALERRNASPAFTAPEVRASPAADAAVRVDPPDTGAPHGPEGVAMDADPSETGVPSDVEGVAMDADPSETGVSSDVEGAAMDVDPPKADALASPEVSAVDFNSFGTDIPLALPNGTAI